MGTRRQFLLVAGAVAVAGCGSDTDDGAPTTAGTTAGFESELEVTSSAFDEGGTILGRHTGVGEDVSPPLRIESVPDRTETLALILDDPDASDGPFVHWLLWNVPATADRIPEGLPQEESLPELDGALQGTNDFGVLGYRGPLPPEGDDPHTYRFTVSAVDSTLDLSAGATREELDEVLQGARNAVHVINAQFGR